MTRLFLKNVFFNDTAKVHFLARSEAVSGSIPVCLVLPARNRHVSQKSEAKLTKRCNVAWSIYCLAETISRRRGKMYLFFILLFFQTLFNTLNATQNTTYLILLTPTVFTLLTMPTILKTQRLLRVSALIVLTLFTILSWLFIFLSHTLLRLFAILMTLTRESYCPTTQELTAMCT